MGTNTATEYKFKLGDRVKFVDDNNCIVVGISNSYSYSGMCIMITYKTGWYGDNNKRYTDYTFLDGHLDPSKRYYGVCPIDLTLISKPRDKESITDWSKTENCEIKKERKTLMSSIKDIARNITRSADDKLLIKHGLLNEDGSYTNLAEGVIIQELCKEKKDLLVKFANIAEEESNKK
jgi:hypothetical protein